MGMKEVDCTTISINIPAMFREVFIDRFPVHRQSSAMYSKSLGMIYLNGKPMHLYPDDLITHVVKAISHETLHRVLHKTISEDACSGLDRLLIYNGHYNSYSTTESGMDW